MNMLLENAIKFLEREEKTLPRKINIYNVPEFCSVMDTYETEEFKKLAIAGLEAAPLQFWIMPAAMRKGVHDPCEHGTGEVQFDEVNNINYVKTIGGKAFHTLRVLDIAEIMMKTDDPRITDFRGKSKIICGSGIPKRILLSFMT